MACIKTELSEDVGDFERDNFSFEREKDENINHSNFQSKNMEDNCDLHKRVLEKYNNTSVHVEKEILFDHVDVKDIESFVEKNSTINQSLVCVKEEIDVKYQELEINEGFVFPCTYCGLTYCSPLYEANHKQLCSKIKHSESERKYMCEECGKKFKTKQDLNQHAIIHTGERLFICELCDKRFNRQGNLHRHVNTVHNREKKFQCSICNKNFSHSCDLNTHKRKHSEVKPYGLTYCSPLYEANHKQLCSKIKHSESDRKYMFEECGKKFKTKQDLIQHAVIHTGERLFICELCDKRFNRQGNLHRHVNTVHNREKKFQCSICNKKFSHSCNLNTHKRTHSEVKPFCCDICNKTFTQSSNLTKHMRVHTGFVSPCIYCGLTFCSPLYEAKHKQLCSKIKHSESDRKYMCEECGKKVKTKKELNQHKVTHTGERLFICELCDKRFTQKGNLDKHVNTVHNREKKFQCDVCNKKFSQSGHLNTHKRTHSKEMPFSCGVCNKTFTYSNVLTVHMRIHTGERPYSCNTCSKTFVNLSNLTTHLTVHTSEKSYSCTFCDVKFSHSSSMKRHIKTNHEQH